ncbi:MAG: hypothetical protein QXD81_02130 [Candidatus Bathyarchaeia archaeon]
MTPGRPTITDVLPALRRARRIRHRIDLAIWNLERLRSLRAFKHLDRALRDLEALVGELEAKGKVEVLALEARQMGHEGGQGHRP